MKKILFFYPHNPIPPGSGSHRRCLEILSGLTNLGCRIQFLSSPHTSDRIWTKEGIDVLEKVYNLKVFLFKSSPLNLFISRMINSLKQQTRIYRQLLNSYSFIGMKNWFSKNLSEFNPDIVFMNYGYWDNIIDHSNFSYLTTIIEMHDLVTLNSKLQSELKKKIKITKNGELNFSEKILDLNFFNEFYFEPDLLEYEIYDKYTYTICISNKEFQDVSKATSKTKTVLLPMTQSVPKLFNSYSGPALFTSGPNPFNLQGYYFFVRKIFPKIQTTIPDFSLNVSGRFYFDLVPEVTSGINYLGFINDLQNTYQEARFFICPVFGGTGQQVKIVEAMAHGLPVITFRFSAISSPIKHLRNGFIAESAKDFAEYVVRLWKNPDLCRKMGKNASETISSEYSKKQLTEGLSKIISS